MAESNTAEKKNEVEPSKGKEGEADAANGSNGCDDEPPLTEDDLKAVENVKDRLKFFFSDANLRQDRYVPFSFLLHPPPQRKNVSYALSVMEPSALCLFFHQLFHLLGVAHFLLFLFFIPVRFLMLCNCDHTGL